MVTIRPSVFLTSSTCGAGIDLDDVDFAGFQGLDLGRRIRQHSHDELVDDRNEHRVVIVFIAGEGDAFALLPLLEFERDRCRRRETGSCPVLPGSFGHASGGTSFQMCCGIVVDPERHVVEEGGVGLSGDHLEGVVIDDSIRFQKRNDR